MDDARWRGLYRMGGITALAVAVLLIGEVVVYAAVPRASTAAQHFELFRDHPFIGLLSLDLLGMVAYLLLIPTMLALYLSLHRTNEAVTLVATVLFFLGLADFFATNTAFPVLTVAARYAAATTEADRAMSLAAGETLFALFNENAFLESYVLVSAAWALVSFVMLRSTRFSRLAGASGVLAGATAILAVVLEHVPGGPWLLNTAIGFYFAAIVFLFLWVLLAGRRLLQASRAA